MLRAAYACYHRCLTACYRLYLRAAGVPCGRNLKLFGLPVIWPCRRGQIAIGTGVVMRSSALSNPVGLNHRCILRTIAPEAWIRVGDGVSMSGTTLLARKGITLGRGVMIGANCTIVDSDLHPLEAEGRRALDPGGIQSAEVVIEDGAFLGMGVMVLKGARIGRNTVVGAGAVVAGSLPPGVIAAGNPARVIKSL
jgi:carbonic anhydrase/acetyltransferase-like protein (isoleucine patch superfamily)